MHHLGLKMSKSIGTINYWCWDYLLNSIDAIAEQSESCAVIFWRQQIPHPVIIAAIRPTNSIAVLLRQLFFPGQTGGSPILKVSMIYPCPDMMHQVKDWINSVSSLVLVSRRAKHVRQDLAGGGGVGWVDVGVDGLLNLLFIKAHFGLLEQ